MFISFDYQNFHALLRLVLEGICNWFIQDDSLVGTYEFMAKGNPQNPQILILP